MRTLCMIVFAATLSVPLSGASCAAVVGVGSPRDVDADLFTMASGHPQNQGENACPCEGGTNALGFVGPAFFCDKAGPIASGSGRPFDTTTPLWGDGAVNQCLVDDAFIDDVNVFVRENAQATAAASDIEIRLMGNQSSDDEDVAITSLQLFVRE